MPITLVFVIVFNLWIWQILNYNPLIAILVIITSFSFYKTFSSPNKKPFYISIILLAFLLLFQYQTSHKNSLTFLNDNEKLHQEVRMRGYPPTKFTLAGKTIWIPTANWLEQRKETLIFYKLQANLAETIDPNLYFFANHPRERVGVVEKEKFAYILLPFFVLGLFSLKKNNIKLLLLALSPLILISIIGNSNTMGPFSLFPFIAVFTSLGLRPIFTNKKLLTTKWKDSLLPFLIVFALVFIQTIAYAKY